MILVPEIKFIGPFRLFLAAALFYSLQACEKKELPVEGHDPGEIQTVQIGMESDYRYQVYYDLETNTEVARNLKTEWDLGFESTTDGYHVITNSAKLMQVYHTENFVFSEVTSLPSHGWLTDEPTGELSLSAIGEWVDVSSGSFIPNLEVLIIDRGYSFDGIHQGYRKIILENVTEFGYSFKFANLDGTDEHSFDIIKDNDYNYQHFSFENQGELRFIQPPKTEWDLAFTQYTSVFYDIPVTLGLPPSFTADTLVYLVNGVMQNPYNTLAYQDSLVGFDDFQSSDISSVIFESVINTIGFDWKAYLFEEGIFIIYSEKNYIVQDQNGFLYKLHFTDFYDEFGQKGTPTFEVVQL